MEEIIDTKEEFSILKRGKGFVYASRGICVLLKTTHNAWIHVSVFAIAVVLGFFFHITRIEWVLITFAGGFVLVSEAFNTALEIDINLTSPTYHPYAKDVKDVAAGAVLLSALTALVVGILIFGPYLINTA